MFNVRSSFLHKKGPAWKLSCCWVRVSLGMPWICNVAYALYGGQLAILMHQMTVPTGEPCFNTALLLSHPPTVESGAQ